MREAILGIGTFESLGGKPARFHIEAEPGCRMKQGGLGGPMGMLLGIEVA